MQQLQVMNFLNEVAMQFPDAISLASGRPNLEYFSSDDWPDWRKEFIEHYARQKRISTTKTENLLNQYGPSAGLINDILARYLENDEGIQTEPNDIIITNGCQEALTLISLYELKEPSDCMLTIDPSYIGFSGLLEITGKHVEPIDVRQLQQVEDGETTFNWDYLCERIGEIKNKGYNPKAIYVNPDFNNPMAYRINKSDRIQLLEVCAEHKIRVIEDNPYARFDYTAIRPPSLKALDQNDIVYHIGSFSKTVCPGLRMGFMVLPRSDTKAPEALIALKSLVSLNSCSLAQSVLGGLLIRSSYSLNASMEKLNKQYLSQRDAMLSALEQAFSGTPDISWNMPQGGFFIVVNLPMDFSEDQVFECAQQNHVVCMPVGFFSLIPERWNGVVRLAFSHFNGDILQEGVGRFGQYVNNRLL